MRIPVLSYFLLALSCLSLTFCLQIQKTALQDIQTCNNLNFIFDLDSNLNPAYSDFTETHDYANTKGLNQSDFLKYKNSTTNLFNQKEVILQQEQRVLLSQLLENESKNESEPDLKED